MPSPQFLKALRLTHHYIGVFIAPAVLFFAFSGALQTFGLHETNRDHPNYTPAKWMVVLAQIHKKQTDVVPVKHAPAAPKAQPSAPAGDASTSDHPHHAKEEAAQPEAAPAQSAEAPKAPASGPDQTRKRNPLPLRIFFLLVAIGLITSTLTGLWMAYTYNRNKLLVTVTLLAGAILPLLLLLA